MTNTYPTWLPADQEFIAYELARVDDLGWNLVEAILAFLEGAAELDERVVGGEREVFVSVVREPPPVIAILFGEAIKHLRSALEHSLFALVEAGYGQPLTGPAAKAVSFPVCPDEAAFKEWLGRTKRVPGLGAADTLTARIRSLQPFVDTGRQVPNHSGFAGSVVHDHPLLLLQQYSNIDKHRRVHAAVSQELGIDMGAIGVGGYRVVYPPPGPYNEGQVISRTPQGQPTEIVLRPAVTVDRPTTTGGWAPPVLELFQLHKYVAEVAIPTLFTGAGNTDIPPRLNLRSTTFEVVGTEYAYQRSGSLIAAKMAEAQSSVRLLSST